MQKKFSLIVFLIVFSFTFGQKYTFNSALTKTKYGDSPETNYIGSDGIFYYNGTIILDFKSNWISIDGVPYKILSSKKEIDRNGTTKISVELLYRNQSGKKFIGIFSLKSEAYISKFILKATKMLADYNIELQNYQQ